VVLVKNEATYLSSIRLHDLPKITVFVTAIGTKSFSLGYQVYVGATLCATGTSTLVCFNNHTKQTIEIPEPMNVALTSLLI
jgi:acyl-CoA thioesterase FadM